MMLHYIYSRSFINVITFMVLALAAWGAMPAFVGARRWRWGNLALMLMMTVLLWVNSATASISSFSFSGSTLAVASCLYTQIPESRINTELFNHHQKTEYPYNHTENAF